MKYLFSGLVIGFLLGAGIGGAVGFFGSERYELQTIERTGGLYRTDRWTGQTWVKRSLHDSSWREVEEVKEEGKPWEHFQSKASDNDTEWDPFKDGSAIPLKETPKLPEGFSVVEE